jgi:hypothetical protein
MATLVSITVLKHGEYTYMIYFKFLVGLYGDKTYIILLFVETSRNINLLLQ